MAGQIKVDSINADSNLTLKIANTAVAFIDATGLRPTSGNVNLDATATSKLYLPSANTVAIQTTGVTAVTVSSAQNVTLAAALAVTGVTTVQAGTAALPAITTTGDLNTGIFFPAADTIAFSEGGVESMRIDSSGNVGIGTSSPGVKLDVNGALRVGLASNPTTIASNSQLYDQSGIGPTISGYNFEVRTGNPTPSSRMFVDSSGNLGIGTASPGARVDVRTAALGTALQLSDDTNYGVNFIGISGGLKLAMNGTQTFSVFQTTNERLTIDGSGNLKFNSGYGSAATAYGCRAWVNFNGTGTVAIRASGNVSSITDNGVGDYTVNFTTAMPDANYAFNGGGIASGVGADARGPVITQHTTMSTSQLRFYANRNGDNGANPVNLDYSVLCVGIFR